MNASPMSRLLGKRTLRTVLGLLVLIEAIFLAESFTTLMETVVRNGGSALDLAMLLLLKMPEVVDFALPLALLIGLYFAIIGAREDNELIVCAAAGVPWYHIPRFALSMGLLAFVASVLVAGYLNPVSKYALRLATHYLETKSIIAEITEPSPKNTIRQIDGRTVIATPPEDPAAERGNLLIFEPDLGNGWRISQADDWTVQERDDGDYVIVMQSFRDYAGRSGSQPEITDTGLRRQIQMSRITVQNLKLDFEIAGLIKAINRARSEAEQILISGTKLRALIAPADPDTPVNRRFAEMIGRALLCPFAALLAVAAAAFSGTGLGRFLALPGAVVLVMGGDIGARTILGDAAAGGVGAFWTGTAVMAAILIALPLLYIAKRREGMIAPGRGRA